MVGKALAIIPSSSAAAMHRQEEDNGPYSIRYRYRISLFVFTTIIAFLMFGATKIAITVLQEPIAIEKQAKIPPSSQQTNDQATSSLPENDRDDIDRVIQDLVSKYNRRWSTKLKYLYSRIFGNNRRHHEFSNTITTATTTATTNQNNSALARVRTGGGSISYSISIDDTTSSSSSSSTKGIATSGSTESYNTIEQQRDLQSSSLGECQVNCQTASNCQLGLVCARQYGRTLDTLGYNPTKAYCTGYPLSNIQNVCYDPTKIIYLKECKFDCDLDADCDTGLLCADEHKDELEDLGYDRRKAYCTGYVGLPNEEVCYDPKKILQCKSDQFVIDHQCCMKINFDDYTFSKDPFNPTEGYQKIERGYRGLNWDNMYVQRVPVNNATFGYATGFRYGTISLPNHAYNGFGDGSAVISIVGSSTNPIFGNRTTNSENLFSFKSLFATPALTDNLIFIIEGYDAQNKKVAESRVNLKKINASTFITSFSESFKRLAKIKISAVPSASSPPSIFKDGIISTHVVVDDIILCAPKGTET